MRGLSRIHHASENNRVPIGDGWKVDRQTLLGFGFCRFSSNATSTEHFPHAVELSLMQGDCIERRLRVGATYATLWLSPLHARQGNRKLK